MVEAKRSNQNNPSLLLAGRSEDTVCKKVEGVINSFV